MKFSLSSRSKQLQARNKTNAQVPNSGEKNTMHISLVTEVEQHAITFSHKKRKDTPM